MLSLDASSKSRKRSLRDAANKQRDNDNNKRRTTPPVICLTGLTPDEKDKYHAIILQLGARYTRNLDSTINTHLIARQAVGAKYEAALQIASLQIVQPTWLDACARQQAWVDITDEYKVVGVSSSNRQEDDNVDKTTTTTTNVPQTRQQHPPLLPQLEQQLAVQDRDALLFQDVHVLLIGFDRDKELKAKLSRLLRRGMATIHWTPRDVITHIVIADGQLEEYVHDAARLLAEQHVNFPSIVSPRWVVACWERNKLLDTQPFAPTYIVVPIKPAVQVHKKAKTTTASSALLFRGSIFCFLRVSPPPQVVDFDRDTLQALALEAGGQVLSTEMVQALRRDKARGVAPRTLYVVCWGSYAQQESNNNFAMHSLLSQIVQQDVCNVCQVTPVWLQTVVQEKTLISPSRWPELFVPTRPLRKLQVASMTPNKKLSNDDTTTTTLPFRICVTGHAGVRRKAMKFALLAMGAAYDESLRPSTTHLICQEAKGSKFDKAIEWNIPTVSIEWLYHVAAFGYQGAKGGYKEEDGKGCEAEFCITRSSSSTTTTRDADHSK